MYSKLLHTCFHNAGTSHSALPHRGTRSPTRRRAVYGSFYMAAGHCRIQTFGACLVLLLVKPMARNGPARCDENESISVFIQPQGVLGTEGG